MKIVGLYLNFLDNTKIEVNQKSQGYGNVILNNLVRRNEIF